MCVSACMSQCMCGSQKTTICRGVLSFRSVDTGIELTNLGSKLLYPLSHFTTLRFLKTTQVSGCGLLL